MPAANTHASYGSVTRTIHWLMAIMIIGMIPMGIYANTLAHEIEAGATDPALIDRAAFLFSLHKTTGIAIFFAALFRILWALSQPKPDPLHPERRAETFLASLVHWLLYASLLLVPLSGWVHHAATEGFAPIWWPFGQSLPLVPKSVAVAETTATLHIVFERVLVISLLLHVAGALKHHLFDRDDTLRRMWSGTPASGRPHLHSRAAAPLAALGIYAAVLGGATAAGLFAQPTASMAETDLAEVSSDWQVTDGSINISITQLGSDVTGGFSEWTSAITYDPDVTDGEAGSVETTIAIPSLSLGSVTAQAMGADYFNAEAFATATYTGTIIAGPEGLRSEGTLTIKDTAIPVSFPFDLTLEGDTATMTGTTTLNRFDFGIGTTTDEGSLAAEVIVTLEVIASRAVAN